MEKKDKCPMKKELKKLKKEFIENFIDMVAKVPQVAELYKIMPPCDPLKCLFIKIPLKFCKKFNKMLCEKKSKECCKKEVECKKEGPCPLLELAEKYGTKWVKSCYKWAGCWKKVKQYRKEHPEASCPFKPIYAKYLKLFMEKLPNFEKEGIAPLKTVVNDFLKEFCGMLETAFKMFPPEPTLAKPCQVLRANKKKKEIKQMKKMVPEKWFKECSMKESQMKEGKMPCMMKEGKMPCMMKEGKMPCMMGGGMGVCAKKIIIRCGGMGGGMMPDCHAMKHKMKHIVKKVMKKMFKKCMKKCCKKNCCM